MGDQRESQSDSPQENQSCSYHHFPKEQDEFRAAGDKTGPAGDRTTERCQAFSFHS